MNRQQQLDKMRHLHNRNRRHLDFTERHPILTILGGLFGVLFINLLFWAAIIAMIAFAIAIVF